MSEESLKDLKALHYFLSRRNWVPPSYRVPSSVVLINKEVDPATEFEVPFYSMEALQEKISHYEELLEDEQVYDELGCSPLAYKVLKTIGLFHEP